MGGNGRRGNGRRVADGTRLPGTEGEGEAPCPPCAALIDARSQSCDSTQVKPDPSPSHPSRAGLHPPPRYLGPPPLLPWAIHGRAIASKQAARCRRTLALLPPTKSAGAPCSANTDNPPFPPHLQSDCLLGSPVTMEGGTLCTAAFAANMGRHMSGARWRYTVHSTTHCWPSKGGEALEKCQREWQIVSGGEELDGQRKGTS